jgi:hypothetical protein
MVKVFRKNEVSLVIGGENYFIPTAGPVEKFNAAQFPQKQVFGDPTKDDELLTSTYIPVSDQQGGIGVYDADEEIHADRCFWSEAELGLEGHLILPPLVTATTNPGANDPAIGIEYANTMYWAFATAAHKWAEGTTTWGSSLKTLKATPTSVIVHKSKLYWAGDSDFDRFDGTTWTDGATLGSAQKCRYFAEWDSKLFALDNDGQLDYTVDEGVTWITSAKSDLPAGSFTNLFTYRDLAGIMILYMNTTVGLFDLSFDTSSWRETELTNPLHDKAGAGSAKWYDGAYVPLGGSINRYRTSNPVEITPVGPDQNYGLPGNYRGNIIKIIPGQAHFYALIDATSALARDTYLANYQHAYGNIAIHDNLGFSALLKSDSLGNRVGRWSVVYTSSSTARPAKDAVITTADGNHRLWFAADDKVHHTALQLAKTNPLEDSSHEYATSAEHITPWFDANRATASKLAARVTGYINGTSATEYITVDYGLDYDDDTWTNFTSTTFTDGQVDADGEFEFTFASSAGRQFRAIRFRVTLKRGTASTKVTPDLHWLRLSYTKQLEARYGFRFKADCSRNYRNRTAKTLLAQLEVAENTKTLMAFAYNNVDTHYVQFLPMSGQDGVALDDKGIRDVVLVAP